MATKVMFQGTEYWLLTDADGDFGPLAPLEHCDAGGNLIMLGVSFAHLYKDGNLIRYGQKIGTREDLVRV